MSTPDEMLALASEGRAVGKPSLDPNTIYQQEEIACSLTLDQKQAWILLVLLAPYKEAEPDNWDIYRAAWHVRRRLAEALGYE